MKKIFGTTAVILLITVFCSAFFSPISSATSENIDAEPQNDPVLTARFLNILNHNASYDDDFNSVDTLVENAVCLIASNTNTDDEFVSESIVAGYMMDMYGIEITDASELNPELPHKTGYIYIIPRGLTSYKHQFISAVKNEDGSYTVKTSVTVKCHDSASETFEAVSLFVPSRVSAFGFNLISSEITENRASVV